MRNQPGVSDLGVDPTALPGPGTEVPETPTFQKMSMSSVSMRTFPNSQDVTTVANELLDAADKQIPTLGLNARRKFFHGLAVAMFVPGIALDVGFTFTLLLEMLLDADPLSLPSHTCHLVLPLRCSHSSSTSGTSRCTPLVQRCICS